MISDSFVGKIVQCHIDPSDPSTFVVGRLVQTDKEWILFQDISPEGRWNGLALYLQSDVVAIEDDSKYLRSIEILLEYWGESATNPPCEQDDLLVSLLTDAIIKKEVIGVELYRSGLRDIIGIPTLLENSMLCILQIDEYGENDGVSYLHIDAITRLYMEDTESLRLDILHRKANSGNLKSMIG